MAKILHIADVHLDSPFSLLDPQKSQARRNELRGTFTSAMMYAKMEKYDIVIIAGDLFDCEFVTRETMDLITSQFAANPDCKFVIAPKIMISILPHLLIPKQSSPKTYISSPRKR